MKNYLQRRKQSFQKINTSSLEVIFLQKIVLENREKKTPLVFITKQYSGIQEHFLGAFS